MDNNEIMHYGVPGMKWGVRKAQPTGGSGGIRKRKKTNFISNKLSARKQRKLHEQEVEKAKQIRKKSVSEMTDAELATSLRRAQMEAQYKALRPEEVPRSKKFMSALGGKVIAPAATAAGKRFLENTLNKWGDKLLKDAVDPNSYEALKKEYDTLDLKKKISDLKNPKKDPYAEMRDAVKNYNTEKAYKKMQDSIKQEAEASVSSSHESTTRTASGQGNSNKSTRKVYDADFVDVYDVSPQTIQLGERYVAGLLGDGKKRR